MKRIVCMIIVGIMMISLAACSQSGGEINSSEPTLSEGEISTDTDITTEGNSSNDEKNFIVNVRVRKDDGDWVDEMEVNIGDEIEYEIHYKNTTDSKAESIAFKFIEPEELDFVEGTAMLYNESNPDGLVLDVDEDAIIKQGVAIGGYEVNGDGYVRAKFVVNDSDEFTSKKNTLRMWGQIDDGNLTLEDSADIILYMN